MDDDDDDWDRKPAAVPTDNFRGPRRLSQTIVRARLLPLLLMRLTKKAAVMERVLTMKRTTVKLQR